MDRIDAEIAAKSEYGHDVDDGMGDDDMDMDIGAGAELNEDGGNVAGAAGARLWLVPLLRQALEAKKQSLSQAMTSNLDPTVPLEELWWLVSLFYVSYAHGQLD